MLMSSWGCFFSIFCVHSNLGLLGLCEHHDVFGIAVGLYIRWVEVLGIYIYTHTHATYGFTVI